jgi:hypothetical protein
MLEENERALPLKAALVPDTGSIETAPLTESMVNLAEPIGVRAGAGSGRVEEIDPPPPPPQPAKTARAGATSRKRLCIAAEF